MSDAVSKVLSAFLHVLTFLSREGSWTLLPHEAATLEAALAWMPAETAHLARQQLGKRHFIERIPNGRIPNFRFYNMDPALRFRGEFEHGTHFIKVRLKAAGRYINAKCVLHEGYVFGLEFPKPSGFFKNVQIEVISAKYDDSSFSYTEVMDRAAHGSSMDH